MASSDLRGLVMVTKGVARAAARTVAPALLRKIDLARARRRYTRPPQRGPRRVLLEVTTGCNYRCLMCPAHSSLLQESTPTKAMLWGQIEALLREVAAMGTEQVWLAGRGEPLVHPDASRIVALATSLGMRSMITTNAGILNDTLADELCAAGLGMLNISINSGCPGTYGYVHGARPEERERILTLMKRLSQRPQHPWLSASMVLLRPNLPELLDFVKETIISGVREIDILGLRFAEIFPTLALNDEEWERARQNLAAAAALSKQAGVAFNAYDIPRGPARARKDAAEPDRSHWSLGCFVGYQFAQIDVDGHVHGCCSCSDYIANLDGVSFADIWHSPSYERFRQVCRDMPANKLTPYGCNCRDCGNVMDNKEAHGELQFLPISVRAEGIFATRLDLAQVVWDRLGDLLPRCGDAGGYEDIAPDEAEAAWTAVCGLQSAGVMVGISVPGHRPLFMPRRLTSCSEAAVVLQRSASLLGVDDEQSQRLVASVAPRLMALDPLLKSELEGWVRAVRCDLAQTASLK